jgi:hypothetical protein
MRIGRAKEYTIRNDDRGAATIVEQPEKKVEEKNFGFLDLRRKCRIYIACVNGSLNGGLARTIS